MKLCLTLIVFFIMLNVSFAVEIRDTNNVLSKLDERIGDLSFVRAFSPSPNEKTPSYLELGCLNASKSTWCSQKNVYLDTEFFENYETIPPKIFTRFLINSKDRFVLSEEEYVQNNRNFIRMFINTFISKKIGDFKKRFSKFLIFDENQGCFDDRIEITRLSEFTEFNKKMMKIEANLKICSAASEVATFDILFLFGPGSSMISRLKEFKIGFDNIGYYRLIRTSGL